jgi:hypothetical protein
MAGAMAESAADAESADVPLEGVSAGPLTAPNANAAAGAPGDDARELRRLITIRASSGVILVSPLTS